MTRPRLATLVLGLATLVAVAEVAHAQAEDESAEDEGAEGDKPADKKPETSTLKLVIGYGLALVGLGIVGAAVAQTFQNDMSYPAAKLGLVNLLRTNPNSAELVCKARKATFHEAIAAAFKTAALIGPQDAAMYATATTPSYDGGAVSVAIHWKTLLGKAKLGLVAAVGGLVLVALGGDLPIPIVIIVVLVLVGFGRLFLHKAEVERTLVLARAEILPEVDRALASGRYAFPPRPAG